MNTERISLGFDLRVNPDSQAKDSSQEDQHLVPELRSPISADSAVWLEPERIQSPMDAPLLDFHNPLYLARSTNDLLIDPSIKEGVATGSVWPVCFTSNKSNVIALVERFGPTYFENRPSERSLLSQGWELAGFDVVDLSGLISGLKGCGFVEPTWSQLRNYFGAALNELGLLGDFSVACRFAEVRGLQIRQHAPFVVVGVLIQKRTPGGDL